MKRERLSCDQLDLTGLVQMALFNFPLGKRTLIRGVQWSPTSVRRGIENNHLEEGKTWESGARLVSATPNEHEIEECLPSEFRRAVHDAIADREPIGLLLSAGYDSRAILAALSNLGHRPVTLTWSVDNSTDESEVARRLSQVCGGQHFGVSAWGAGEKELPALAEEFVVNSAGLANLVRLRAYTVIRAHHEYMNVLLWGEGELIRPVSLPSEYISPAACHLLHPEAFPRPATPAHFFSPDLPWAEAWQEALDLTAPYRAYPPSKRWTLWLLREGYQKVYGALRQAVSRMVPVEMPFLDKRVIEVLLRSPYSIARLPSWQPSLRTTARSRKIYYYLIKANEPGLLHYPVDRGYPPSWDRDWRGVVMTGFWGLRTKLIRRKRNSADYPLQLFLKELLYDPSTLSQDFLDAPAMKKILDHGPPWPPHTVYALAKIATLSLFTRRLSHSSISG